MALLEEAKGDIVEVHIPCSVQLVADPGVLYEVVSTIQLQVGYLSGFLLAHTGMVVG